jgi:hypothetical protein
MMKSFWMWLALAIMSIPRAANTRIDGRVPVRQSPKSLQANQLPLQQSRSLFENDHRDTSS